MSFDGSNKTEVGCARDIDYASAMSPRLEKIIEKQKDLATPEALAWYKTIEAKRPLKVVDASTQTAEEWQATRADSIGSSAASYAFGLCPYEGCTNLDLYYDKLGMKPIIPLSQDEEKKRQKMFFFGHLMEDYLRFVLEQDYPGCEVIVDTWTYADPDHPFLTANLDAMMKTTDGTWIHVEFKTTNEFGDEAYANNSIPPHYRCQLIQCQHILNVWESLLVVAPTRDNIIKRHYLRDLDAEMDQVEELTDFWTNHVLAKIPPEPLGPADNIIKTLRRYSGYAEKKMPEVDLPAAQFEELAQKVMELSNRKAEAQQLLKLVSEELTYAQIPIIQALGKATKGIVKKADNSATYKIKYTPRKGGKKVDLERFQLEHPDLYDEYVAQAKESSRTFSIQLLTS